MKKTFLILLLIMTASVAPAQISGDMDGFVFTGKNPPVNKDYIMKKMEHKAKNNAIGWLVPSWDLLDYYYVGGAGVTHYANVIYPDSTPVYESGGIISHNWLISVGGVLDPYSPLFDSLQSLQFINNGEGYYLDSVFILGWYTKVNSGPDTLMLEIVHGAPTVSPAFAHTIFSYPDDTLHVSPPKVYGSTVEQGFLCQMTAPGRTLIKYILTDADSTNYYGKYITIPVGMDIPADNVVGISITFVPGSPYGFGDMGYSYSGTETQVVNSFRAGLYSTDDTGADPHLFGEPYYGYSASHYIRKQVRYAMYTGSNAWRNERMVSTMSWGFDIGYFISDTAAASGVSEYLPNQSEVFPNPVENVLNISNENCRRITTSLYNHAGMCVGEISSSLPLITMDMSKLAPGIYFVRVSDGVSIRTEKIIKQ